MSIYLHKAINHQIYYQYLEHLNFHLYLKYVPIA